MSSTFKLVSNKVSSPECMSLSIHSSCNPDYQVRLCLMFRWQNQIRKLTFKVINSVLSLRFLFQQLILSRTSLGHEFHQKCDTCLFLPSIAFAFQILIYFYLKSLSGFIAESGNTSKHLNIIYTVEGLIAFHSTAVILPIYI